MTATGSTIPNLFLIGAPKCATTSIATMLVGSPEVSHGASKEPGIFTNPDYRRTDREKLLATHYANATTVRWRLDATPWLLYDAGAYDRIREHESPGGTPPDRRFLCSLRDPMDRIRSMYHDQFRRGTERRPFADAVSASLTAPHRAAHRALRHTQDYVTTSCYSGYLEAWRTTLEDRDPLHVLFFESVMADPTRTAETLGALLDVELDALPHDNDASEGTAAGTATIDRLARAGRRLPPTVRTPLRRVGVTVSSAVLRRMPARERETPDLSIDDAGLVAELDAVLDEERERLSIEIGRHRVVGEIPAWLRPGS